MSERIQFPIVLGLCAALAALALAFDFTPDDAYISFRYARNWAEGRGLVYNPGEYVEGYSNFAWVALLGAAARAGFDIEAAARAAGIACAAALVLALYGFTRAREGRWAGVLACAAAVLFLPLPAWAAAGLETPLFCLAAFAACASWLAGAREGRLRVVTGNWLALAALTRVDGVLVFPALVVGQALARPRVLRSLWRPALTLLLIAGGYWLLRWRYYGDFWPNTYYVKVAAVSDVSNGRAYLSSFLWLYPSLVLAFLCVGWALWARARRGALDEGQVAILFFGCLAAAYMAWTVYTDGDWMPAYRRFAVLCAPAAYLLAAGFRRADRWLSSRASDVIALSWRVGRVLVLLVLLEQFAEPLARELMGYSACAYSRMTLARMRELTRAGRDVGLWLKRRADPGDCVASLAIGALGYFSNLKMLDMRGLVDRRLAREGPWSRYGWPGHKIRAPVDYVVERRPEFIIEVPGRGEPAPPSKLDSSPYPGYRFVCFHAPDLGGYWACLVREDVFRTRCAPAPGGGYLLQRPRPEGVR